METLECIKSRRSVRRYSDKEIAWNLIANIIDAARHAPSAGNLQNWKFIIILDRSKRESIAKACLNQLWMAKAPVHIVIVSETNKAKELYEKQGEIYTIQGCAAAAQNIMLEACNLNLGSCWVGAFVKDQIKKILGIEDFAEPQAIITIGYPEEEPSKPAKWPLENVTYFNGWRNKIKDPSAYMGYYSDHLQKNIAKAKDSTIKAKEKVKDKLKNFKENITKKIQQRS